MADTIVSINVTHIYRNWIEATPSLPISYFFCNKMHMNINYSDET